MAKAALFNLIHHLLKSRKTMTYFASAMYLLNLAIHIAVYLSMPLIHRLHISSIITNLTPTVLFTGFALLVVVEVVFYLVKKRELYLTHQLMVFRFIFSPLLTLSILQGATNKQLPVPVALPLLLFGKVLSTVLSKSLLYETHRHYTLRISSTSIVAELDIFEIILIANVFVTALPIQFVFAFGTLACALVTGYKHFIRSESEDIEYRILHLANTLHIIFSLYYVLLIILTSLQPGYFFFSLLPFVGLAIFAAYSKFKSTKDNLQKALLNEVPFNEFVESIDCFLILARLDFSRNKRRLVNYIYSIVGKHRAKCLLAGCELKNQSTEEELKSMTTKNLQQLLHKIMKKIEWILQGYHSKAPQDIAVAFTLLKFYAEYYPSRMSMQTIINQINEKELDWHLQCELTIYRLRCMSIANIDSIDVEKDEQVYLQFKNVMVSTLNCIIQFWREFNEEKVDLSRIMQIAAKLFPFKARVDQIFQEQLEVQKFTAFKILKLYAEYSHKILKKVQFAAKVQDLLSILGNWLRDKQDIQYLSKESEAGIIIICLSQSKLGDIFMVNERACDIFHYPKKQMLGLRVNAIMPSVFADIHDRILTDFLKKKRKKYNTDQRLLFGKDGNGYMFPLKLQLQRASYSSKDEYIFIASICPEKVRSAPMYCIVDHEGEITDCTASFRNVFFSRSKKWSSRSIQDIIPGYFETDWTQKNTEARHFTSFINNKKLGEIQAKFEISPILVKSQHEGYLVKMTYENQRTVSAYKNLRFTDNLRDLMAKNAVKGRQTHYSQITNSYELQKLAHVISFRASSPQFTLPFLNYEDVALFANSTQVKQYGKDIKTIRYVGNHFQRIDQDQSFMSESFDNEDKVDIKTKIEELKHRFDHKEERSVTTIYKILINAIVAITIAVAFSVYTIYQNEVAEELQFLKDLDKQKQVLYYLPEYVVSFTCAQAGINPEFYNKRLLQIKPIIISNAQSADLKQNDKEDILKIIYLKSPTHLVRLFESSTFVLPQSDVSVNGTLKVMWGLMAGISIGFVVMFAVMFYHLNYAFLNIYTVFLSINDSSIKKIEESCRWMIDEIYCTTQGSIEKEDEKKGEEDEENEIEKIKQFKNNNRKQDLFVFAKIATPLTLIIAFLFIMLGVSNSRFSLYLSLKQQHNVLLDSIPAQSLEMAKVVLKVSSNVTLGISNQYDFYYQQIERNVLHFNQNTKRSLFLDSLYGNICLNSGSVKSSMLVSCNSLGNSILKSGITSTVNFIAGQLKNMTSHKALSPLTTDLLFSLQFLFINPALLSIENRMEEMLKDDIQDFGALFSWMILLLVCLYVGFDIYLFWFPLRTIDMEIKLTNEMISLMPDNAGLDNPHSA